MNSTPEVLANGGVMVRKGGHEANDYFCALIHRPKYNDWSLPKGKQETGEEPLQCAIREIQEETGYSCKAVREILSTAYTDDQGRSKLVRYWLMIPESGEFVANDEVDSVVWLPFHLASNALTYERDREVLQSALKALEALEGLVSNSHHGSQ